MKYRIRKTDINVKNMKSFRKNRLLAAGIAAALGVCLLGSTAAYAENIGFARCEEDYINVRSDASAESDVIGKLYQNGRVEILDTSSDGNWYHIRSGNVEGYVSSDFIAAGEDAAAAAEGAGYTTAEVGAEVLNVRASMDSDSQIVGAIYENQKYEVVEDQGDWVKVVTGDGTYGWVSADYVYVSTEYGTAETLEEEQARLDAAWLDYLASQEQAAYDSQAWDYAQSAQATADGAAETAYAAQQEADAAYQAYEDAQAAADASAGTDQETQTQQEAQEAYSAYEQAQQDADAAASAYSDAQSAADTAAATAQESSGSADTASSSAASGTDSGTSSSSSGSATGQAIAEYACQFVGNPYVYGGTSLTSGADCSGFVMSVFANFGISLPHEAASQSGYGTAVDVSSLAPGDLVFYSDGSGISHVAIYIGGGSIVHAANSASGICYGNVNYNTPVACRRLV